MAGEHVLVGDREDLEFEWILNDDSRPISAELRVYIIESDGTKRYWNGSAFTNTDATLSGSFASGIWTGVFVYPISALNKEVYFEARPLGLADIANEYIVDSRRVVPVADDVADSGASVRV
jgi:hypothetical protein